MKKIIFLRHIKTLGNEAHSEKGIKFLGRKSDYNIINLEKGTINALRNKLKGYSLVFSSPSKRCKQTLELITKSSIKEDKRLYEIDYGECDGMYIKEAQKKYHYLFEEWTRGIDIQFPNGENNLDVVLRLKDFIKGIGKLSEDNILICTHNVVLRCLVGSSLKIPVKYWYKINIPHFEPMPFILYDTKLIYIGDKEQKGNLLKNFVQKQVQAYFIALTPEKEIYSRIFQTKRNIYNKFGNQKYLKDPPHCTLYVSLAEDLDNVRNALRKILLKEKQITSKILNEYIEFKGDALAGGGTSLGLKFDEKTNNKIRILQKKVINALNPLRMDKVHPRYRDARLNSELMKNIKEYGFPFVGEVLIPHIDFCTFKNHADAEKFKLMNSPLKFAGSMNFVKLSLYRLHSDNRVELVKEFDLN